MCYKLNLQLWFLNRANISITDNSSTSTIPEIIVNNGHSVEGIAYDWIHGKLYWADTMKSTIELLTMTGRFRKTILKENLDQPYGIAVDPRDNQKWIYWTDFGEKPRIEKSGLDGSNRALVVATNIDMPTDIIIDYSENRLYWVDGRLQIISSCGLDGKNSRRILSDKANHPLGVDVFGDMIYWSEWVTRRVKQANKHNGRLVKRIYRSSTSSPGGLRVYHPTKQPSGKFS